MTLQNLIPMLSVSNIEVSLDFYQKALDFNVISPVAMIQEWRWATIRSGKTELMLSESQCDLDRQKNINPHTNENWPCIYYFYPDNVTTLYDDLTQKGFNPTSLEVTNYGMREFSLQDPDGHLLSFGEDVDASSNKVQT